MRRLLCSLLVFAGLVSCADKSSPATAPRASRIVSLSPSTTELLYVLGAIDALVGRDAYSLEPAAIQKLPVLGDFLSPNVEAIVALQPDLILLDVSQGRAAEALQALGQRTLSLGMHQVQDVQDGLITVGEAIGKRALADKLLAQMRIDIDRHRQQARTGKQHPKVLFIIDRAPQSLRNLVAAGPKTYLDELLNIVGGVNMMAGAPVRYPQLSAEQILRGAPDIIIDLSRAGDDLSAYDLVREVPAAVHKRIHIVDERLLLSPSPRIGEALDQLAELLSMQGV